MVRIGITGGIGSGKSTVSRVWEEKGAVVCQADRLARQLMENDPAIIAEIKEVFGEAAYREDGTLDRDYLAGEAFEGGRVEELNAIVHPRMPEAVDRRISEARRQGAPAFVYEAALLPGGRKPDFVDYLVIVRSPREQRVRRVSERDGTDPAHVMERMRSQPDFDSLEHLADLVIENDGSLGELRRKAEQAYGRLAGG